MLVCMCRKLNQYSKLCRLSSSSDSSWRIFIYKELHIATNGFSDEKKLGEGGFGSVYFGKTYDGLQIAVKKLKSMNSKAVEFAVEVEVLGRVRQKNLLGLRGYCADADQRLIVYDYMHNLSLLSHLHGQYATDVKLDWKRRMRIAIGSAEGLSNGWFETQTKICLSISNHHPEHWQPSWSVQTALVALITFMPTIPNGALGSLDYKKEQRRVLAVKSREAGHFSFQSPSLVLCIELIKY
ncbi:Protein kinase domain-containing protein [Heracleum sosnowskyi]|uniref:Protein kinase domain-containing protein n=1 Tax=Heracleum sosnowskyi TaxID=360622 RepID=A0AAD8H911_9APIA|nr:Protein kinase domain-containing protein [Heracleum sosnowskyi]